jgi:hypothetical protein
LESGHLESGVCMESGHLASGVFFSLSPIDPSKDEQSA